MSWTDEQANCVLEVCCGKDGKQHKALTDVLVQDAGLNPHQAVSVAAFLIDLFDFAPKGTLFAFKQEIARLARGNPYE